MNAGGHSPRLSLLTTGHDDTKYDHGQNTGRNADNDWIHAFLLLMRINDFDYLDVSASPRHTKRRTRSTRGQS